MKFSQAIFMLVTAAYFSPSPRAKTTTPATPAKAAAPPVKSASPPAKDAAPPAPPAAKGSCSLPGYTCNATKTGWQVCDVKNNWLDGGSCAPDTACVNFPKIKSPYCVPKGYVIPGTKH